MVRLAYILLLICTAAFYPLYEDKLSYLTFVTMIILPFLMLIQGMYSACFLKVVKKPVNRTVCKGSEGEVCIGLSNGSFFPMSNTAVRVKIVFRPTNAVRYITAGVPLPARSTQTVTVNIDAEHCGAAEVYLEYVRVHDLLGLFSIKRFRKSGLCGTVFIVPRVSEEYAEEAAAMLSRSREQPESLQDPLRSDMNGAPGDVCGFREFAPGDKLSRMHYKLSARFDKDMVKIYGAQGGARYLLTADLSPGDDLSARDKLLERLMSCAHYLHENNARVYMAVPADCPIQTEKLPGGAAVLYSDRESYGKIACALAGADFTGTLSGQGFICCQITNSE